MEFRQLGLTEYKISRIGFGCAPMGSFDYGKVNDADSIKAVRRALDLGINFFDTADVYGFGHAEKVLGKALGSDRNRVIIATKFGLKWDEKGRVTRDCTPKRVVEALEDSLRRLNVEAITLYQIHWPDHKTPIEEMMEALFNCQKAGKIKCIGCSNLEKDLIENLHRFGRIESFQSPYSLLNRFVEKDILLHCRKLNMTFIAHSPLARGFLSGKYKLGHNFSGLDTRDKSLYFSDKKVDERQQLLYIMKNNGMQYAKTCAQVAIRWILENPLVSSLVVGIKNINQLEENIASIDWKLSAEDFMNLSIQSKMFIDAGLY